MDILNQGLPGPYDPVKNYSESTSAVNSRIDGAVLSEYSRLLTSGLTVAATFGALAFQQSTANESTRAWVGFSALERTGSPLASAVAVGLATLAIEGITGSAAAHALRAKSDFLRRKVYSRLSSDDETKEKPQNIRGDVGLALVLGSAAVVGRRHLHSGDKLRTAREDTRTLIKAAGGIALFSAGVALFPALAANHFNGESVLDRSIQFGVQALSNPKLYGALMLGYLGYAVAKYRKREKQSDIAAGLDFSEFEVADHDPKGYVSVRIDDHNHPLAKKALDFEQQIWDDKEYGSLDEYNEKYLKDTVLYASYQDGECTGTVRIFHGSKGSIDAPFIADMAYSDETMRQKLSEEYVLGETEELATSASMNTTANKHAIRSLWRLAYRDSISRGVKQWGIIMEPPRVRAMNRINGFTFRQLGPAIDYQGGDCAPHVMDLREVVENMKAEKPELLEWFVNEPLKRSF